MEEKLGKFYCSSCKIEKIGNSYEWYEIFNKKNRGIDYVNNIIYKCDKCGKLICESCREKYIKTSNFTGWEKALCPCCNEKIAPSVIEETARGRSINNSNTLTNNSSEGNYNMQTTFNNLVITKKEPWVAVLLSFVITGAGQMYCGRVGKGVGLLIGAIIGWMLFVIPGIGVWIYGMVDAYNMAQEINEETEKNIANHNHIMEQEEAKIKEEAIEKEKSFIKVEDFKERLVKSIKLYENNLITENEHITRKKNIINELLTKKTTISHDDFLYELISLKENNILTNEDMQLIKSHLL